MRTILKPISLICQAHIHIKPKAINAFSFLVQNKVGMGHMRAPKTEMSLLCTIAFGTGLFGAAWI